MDEFVSAYCKQKIKELEESMHDCIKAGLVGPTTNGSQEKDMD